MRKKCVFLVLLAVVSLLSCNDENSQIAEGLFKNDMAKVKPDVIFGMNAIVESDATAVTNDVTTAFVGTYNDPIFGKISAATAFELRTPTDWTFKEETVIVVDSVSMHIGFDVKQSMYDTITKQKVNIYRLNKSLKEVKRFSDLGDAYKGDLLASKEISCETVDTLFSITKDTEGKVTKIDTVAKGNIKFKFEDAFAQTFAKEFINNSSIYANQEAFNDFFKGIYVESDANISSGNGGMFALNITGGKTYLNVYYHIKDEKDSSGKLLEKPKDRAFGFYANNNSKRINTFKHEPKVGVLGSTESIYILGGAGLKANVKLDSLSKMEKWYGRKDLLINKAEIVLKVDEVINMDKTPLPKRLIMVGYNKEGEIIAIPDYIISSPFFNGVLDLEKSEYRFNIAFLIQDIVNNSKEKFYEINKIDLSKGFAVYPENRRESPRRVILDGKSIKLNITYTEL